MKPHRIILITLLLTAAIFGQGEAALSWLYLHPTSPSIGKGWTGVSNMDKDPLNFYYNPAKLANFNEKNTFSFLLMPQKADWGIFKGIKYYSFGGNIGVNLSDYTNGIPLTLGIGFIRNSMDYGKVYVTSSESPDGFYTDAVDASNSIGIGIGLNYKIRFSLGITAKNYISDLGKRYINETPKQIEADGFAYDFGALIYAPISELLLNDYKICMDDFSYINPLIECSFGYSLLNVGGMVKYPYLEGEDPLPRNARLGYSINLGLDMNIRNVEMNFIKYGFTAEADDILVKRNLEIVEDGISGMKLGKYSRPEYDNIFGKIGIGKHLFGLNHDNAIVVHKGHSFSFFETFTYNTGRHTGRGFPNYKSNSSELSTIGISKLLDLLIANDVVDWITQHVVIEYYDINLFVDTEFETNLKGVAVNLTNFSF